MIDAEDSLNNGTRSGGVAGMTSSQTWRSGNLGSFACRTHRLRQNLASANPCRVAKGCLHKNYHRLRQRVRVVGWRGGFSKEKQHQEEAARRLQASAVLRLILVNGLSQKWSEWANFSRQTCKDLTWCPTRSTPTEKVTTTIRIWAFTFSSMWRASRDIFKLEDKATLCCVGISSYGANIKTIWIRHYRFIDFNWASTLSCPKAKWTQLYILHKLFNSLTSTRNETKHRRISFSEHIQHSTFITTARRTAIPGECKVSEYDKCHAQHQDSCSDVNASMQRWMTPLIQPVLICSQVLRNTRNNSG